MKNKAFWASFLFFTFFCVHSFNAQNTNNSSPAIEQLISKKRSFNKEFGYGYVIQIYYGNETKARSLRNKFKLEFPGVYTELDYNKPDWKVLVGRYKTKLEADKAIIKFSEEFTGLIVIPLGK